jgi:hypothetical protein
VPSQHGAWAFLGLPVATAVTLTPSTPALVLLAVTWVAAFPASYFLLAILRDRTARRPDPGRYLQPLLLWWGLLLLCGVPLLVLRPWLAWVALLYLASFAVNVAYARRHDERALGNDLVFIAQCTTMVPVTWAVGEGSAGDLPSAPAHLWVLTVAVGLLLTGSTLHVKSLIRERARPAFRTASRAFAAGSLVASVGLALWWGLPSGLLLVAPYGWFLARSLAMGLPAPRPGRIGIVELVGFVLLVIAAALANAVSTS